MKNKKGLIQILLVITIIMLPIMTYGQNEEGTYVKEETIEGGIKLKYNKPVKRVKEKLIIPGDRNRKEYEVDIWPEDTQLTIDRGLHPSYKRLEVNYLIDKGNKNLNITQYESRIYSKEFCARQWNGIIGDQSYTKDILMTPVDLIVKDWEGNEYTEFSPELYIAINIKYIPEGSEKPKTILKIVKFNIDKNAVKSKIKDENKMDLLTRRKDVARGNIETYNVVRVEKENIKFATNQWNNAAPMYVDGEHEVEIWDENTMLEYIYTNHDDKYETVGFLVKKDGLLYQIRGTFKGGFQQEGRTIGIYDGVVTLTRLRMPKELEGITYNPFLSESLNKSRGWDKKIHTLDNSEIYGYVYWQFSNRDDRKNPEKVYDYETFKLFKFEPKEARQ